MKYSQYNFTFYLNANHAIWLGGVLGQTHPHTWEISLDTIKVGDDFVQFDQIEKSVEKYFAGFQDSDINKIEPFITTNPTLENLCGYFKNELGKLLGSKGWLLVRIEMSETPTRSYIIDLTDEVDVILAANRRERELSRNFSSAADNMLDQILGSKESGK